MELQRLRFLHRIWKKPSSQSLLLLSVRDVTHHLKWIGMVVILAGVVALGRLYPQSAIQAHTWAGCVLTPITGGMLFVERLFYEKIPNYLKTLTNALSALETQDQLRAEKSLLAKKAAFIEQENRELRALLNLPSFEEGTSHAGTIVQRHHHLSSHTLIIRTTQPCPLNSPVMTPQGLLGRVIETHQNTALVLLVQDTRSRIPVMLGNSGVEAIASGDGSDLKLHYLDPHAEIKEGDVVMTSGVGGVFPSGLLLGHIKRTDNGFVVSPFALENRGRFVNILPPLEPLPSFKHIQPKAP